MTGAAGIPLLIDILNLGLYQGAENMRVSRPMQSEVVMIMAPWRQCSCMQRLASWLETRVRSPPNPDPVRSRAQLAGE